ncbi:MAG: S41 family peptidase, partial [Clostridia bacterium]
MATRGYYRFPTIHGDRIVLVADDDLWMVTTAGGTARRLTAGNGPMSRPRFSPDGQALYFVSQDGGEPDLYRMEADGGPMTRITYTGGIRRVAGFLPDGRVIVSTDVRSPFRGVAHLFAVATGGSLEPLNLGPAASIDWGPGGSSAIGRNTGDSATWKRYRGGTAGEIWLDSDGSGHYRRLEEPKGNPGAPFFVGDRLYFISDHEGVGNLYSVTVRGEGLRRHSDCDVYYARNAASDGRRIVYHMGGDVYLYDPASDETHQVPIALNGQRPGRQFRLVDAAPFVSDYDPHPARPEIALTARGQTVSMGAFAGPVSHRSPGSGVRTRLTSWLNDTDVIGVLEQGGEERIVRLRVGSDPEVVVDQDLGAATELVASPDGSRVAVSTHRLELYLVDVDEGAVRLVDHSAFGFRVAVDEWKEGIRGLSWSHDGRYLAYACPDSPQTTAIRVVEAETGAVHTVTDPLLEDLSPSFDPDGRFLFFLGKRDFTPVLDQFAFDLSFPRGIRPYLIPLRSDIPSPFLADTDSDEAEKTEGGAEGDHGTDPAEDAPPERLEERDRSSEIDFDGIAERVIPFPVSAGRLDSLTAISGKVLWIDRPLAIESEEAGGRALGTLMAFDLKARKQEGLLHGVANYRISRDGKTALILQRRRLRRAGAGDKVDESKGDRPGRESGIIDLQRVTLPIEPEREWQQMFREAWRLMREHYWTVDMASVDWDAMYDRYAPLVGRVGTRGELSDLLWELQGELGTSHAYEFGGDYRPSPPWPHGGVGAEFAWSAEHGAWIVRAIVHGGP